ncbi:4Fe-4S binding protein [Candidatus Poribacteria bacterium]|nr:4Fe-4S binding protein [Candidatus Poribacteria bacterium]
MKRKIIKIDENKCDGCGLCMPSCPEQAIQIVDGKAKLVKEFYCDGLGACLGACPTGALTIEEREAEVYDDDATIARIKEVAPEMLETHIKHIKDHVEPQEKHHAHKHGVSACPSANAMSWKPNASETKANQGRAASELNQWPIQLHLVSPMAPYFNNADLLIVADCVPFAYANFHQDFLSGKAIVIGCPKLDDVEEYKEKLTEMFGNANIKSIKVIHMEVPCCFGLSKLVKDSIASSGKKIPFEEKIIGIKGD